MIHKTQVEYKVGDILLISLPYLKEVEITEIAIKAKYIKIGNEWHKVESIAPSIKAVLGRAIYKKGWFGKKRTVQYNSILDR